MATLVQQQYIADLKVAYPSILGDLSAEQIDRLSVPAASRFIDELKTKLTDRWGFKAGTRQSACAQALYAANGDVDEAFAALANGVGRVKALTFYRNPTNAEKMNGVTQRVKLEGREEQREQLRKTLYAVQPEVRIRLQNPEVMLIVVTLPGGENVGEDDSGQGQQQGQSDPQSGSQEPQQQPDPQGGQEPQSAEPTDPEPMEPEPAPEPEPEPVLTPEQIKAQEDERKQIEFEKGLKTLEQKIDRLRDFCISRVDAGSAIDTIGNRPYENGGAMLGAGFTHDAILYAATLHWPPEARREAGAPESFDQAAEFAERTEGKHPMREYVRRSAFVARQPTAMYGEPGTGKTYLARELADDHGLPFGMIPLTGGATPSWLAGAYTMDTAEPYKSRPFTEIYGGGGVFLFDELDGADPNMLLLVNAALANGEFHNPVTGKIIVQHPDFIPLAGMNTLGLGANRHMTGRERLDGATLDRWRMGRVELKLDKKLAHRILRASAAAAADRLAAA